MDSSLNIRNRNGHNGLFVINQNIQNANSVSGTVRQHPNYVKSIPTSPVAAGGINSLRVVHQKQPSSPPINLNLNSSANAANSIMMIAAAQAVAAAAAIQQQQQQSSMSPSTTADVSSSPPPTTTTTSTAVTISPATSSRVPPVHHSGTTAMTNQISANYQNCPSSGVISDRTGSSNTSLLPSNITTVLADRYVLLNQISGSSFYECVDVRTGEALICKAIGNSYTKILSAYFRLDGAPHIKPLHKLLQSTNQTYLLLPPSQYGDLHSYVRERKRLREPEARELFRQICETVKSCHEQGIVLRDLKLRKFVFSDRKRTTLKFESLEDAVVLEDPDDDILKEKIGCPAYVAPEILKPNSDFSGKAADLWSLGVILYTMLVGRYPFNDPEHSSLFAKISRCQFTIPEFLTPKARCLIRSLLQKSPKNRITADDVLYHPWVQEKDNNFYSNIYNCNLVNALNNINNLIPTTVNSSSSSNASSNSNSSSTSNYNNYFGSDQICDDQVVPEINSLDFT